MILQASLSPRFIGCGQWDCYCKANQSTQPVRNRCGYLFRDSSDIRHCERPSKIEGAKWIRSKEKGPSTLHGLHSGWSRAMTTVRVDVSMICIPKRFCSRIARTTFKINLVVVKYTSTIKPFKTPKSYQNRDA